MNADGTDITRLTDNPALDTSPAWSSDRTKIAFVSDRDAFPQIYVMNADGSGETRLTDDRSIHQDPSWSPDGARIAFVSTVGNDADIYLMNSDGSDPVNISNNMAKDTGPQWSPDGTKIVFASNRDGNRERYIMNADGTGRVRVTDYFEDDWDPAWSPDGTKIVFTSHRFGRSEYLVVINTDGSGEIILTDSPHEREASWSPDGSRISFTRRGANHEIHTRNADGSGLTRVTDHPANDNSPSWSPGASDSAQLPATPAPTATATRTATLAPTTTATPASTATPVVVPTPTVAIEEVVVETPTPVVAGIPQFGGTLRIAGQASINSLDPVFSDTYVTNAVSSHIFEQQFAWDANLEVAPRTVKSWEVSPDGLTYTFTMRDGLSFHKGNGAVTPQDIIASFDRWAASRSPSARLVRTLTDTFAAWKVIDDKTYQWTLNEPFDALFALALPSLTSYITTAELAATPFSVRMDNLIGTGAYEFEEWKQGDRVVLKRFEDYVPDSRATNGYTGKTVAYLDKLIWLEIPNEETKVAGLQTGEWDVIDGAAFDFLKRLQGDPGIQVGLYKPGNRSNVYLNPQIPPFSYVKARQALQTGIQIEDYMFALGDRDVWILCPALYWCGTPLETDAGQRFDVFTSASTRTIGYNVKDLETAQILLGDSDYAGEVTIILNPTDYGTITPIGHVLKVDLEKIGFNAEMPALDWATVTTIYARTDSWSASTDWYSYWCCGTPMQDHLISGTFDYIIKDDELIDLQLDWARETDPTRRFAIVEEIQRQRYRKVTSLSLGQFFPIYASTKDLKNFEVKVLPFFANTWLDR